MDKQGLWYARDCSQSGNVICEKSAVKTPEKHETPSTFRPRKHRKDIECSLTTNGTNCFQTRPSHCGGLNKKCHYKTGVCTSGCAVGFKGDKCQSRDYAGNFSRV
ncbi:hypothetical protein ElyMa_001576400, partial [Elysia marginata]